MKIFLLFLVVFLNLGVVWARSYPLKQVSKNSYCKLWHRDFLAEDCKIDLPIIEGARYQDYKNNLLYRRVYTVLRGGTYQFGWDAGFWSHLGVDIATAQWTPVTAIEDGEVITAGWVQGRGNTVVIRHIFGGQEIFSVYAHLDEVLVFVWEKVLEWKLIGKVWQTGNAFGNHLHFQIDINQSGKHPYYYSECGSDVMSIVEDGNCQIGLYTNTLDPIFFLETTKNFISGNWWSSGLLSEMLDAPQQSIESWDFIAFEKLLKEEAEIFLERYDFQVEFTGTLLAFTVIDTKTAKPYLGVLPQDISIEFDKNIIEVSPSVMKFSPWERTFFDLKQKSVWKTRVKILFGGVVFWQEDISLKGYEEIISTMKILKIKQKNHLGQESLLVVFQDSLGTNLVRRDYGAGLSVELSGSFFCGNLLSDLNFFSARMKQKCTLDNQKKNLTLWFGDTLFGLVLIPIVKNGQKKNLLIRRWWEIILNQKF